jgi:hypothetical protein
LTKAISSAEEARLALMKLKSKSGALLLMEFFAGMVSFSLEGHIVDFDGETLQVKSRGFGTVPIGYALPEIILSGFSISHFEGDFREDETDLFLSLWITRPFDECRIHICGQWPEHPKVADLKIQ